MRKIALKTRLSSVLATTEERIRLLGEVGLKTVKDLLEYYPRGYEDLNKTLEIHEIRADQKNVLEGSFSGLTSQRTRQGKLLIKALFTTNRGQSLEAVWFNQPHIKHTLPLGEQVMISAKAKLAYGKVSLQNPTFERQDAEMINVGRITPIYREHGKLSSTWLRQKIYPLLDQVESFYSLLPLEVIENNQLLNKSEAIQEIHFPSSKEKLEKAKETLAFEELFLLQLTGLLRKQAWALNTENKAKQIPLDPELQKRFFQSLPFTLTDGQKVALFEILSDFEGQTAALRLLEGDVGSGKTVVAVAAALPVLEAGLQVAFLAPTEVLANQHFIGIKKLITNYELQITNYQKGGYEKKLREDDSQVGSIALGKDLTKNSKLKTQNSIPKDSEEGKDSLKVELLTGAVKGKKREEVLEGIRKGRVKIVVGTHALIQKGVIWHNLGFVVIDEQHRFGVKQREHLLKQGAPHILQMTATPIPRTLAIVAFGDQDLSVISELPQGRKPIETKVVNPNERTQVERFIASQVQKGRQGFVICPLVEGSDKIVAKSAVEEFERLRKEVFPELSLELLHGRMKSAEKQEVMERFKNKEFDLLVSTAVVEVGVDVPNATIMLIESAERFGLAQLHQFRGRVGRGAEQSYCFLFTSEDIQATKRLKALEQYNDGFKLAEIDLRLRGPGEVFGTQQSGIPELKIASLFDARIIDLARKAAEDYLAEHKHKGAFAPHLREAVEALESQNVELV
jgi:ATP-dependent DNA helicase RecG